MKSLALGIILLAASSFAMATPPYVFTSGSPILASQINANFAYIESLANSSAQPLPSSLIKASWVGSTTGQTIFTVPSTATNPYILRQIIGGYTGTYTCAVSVGAMSFIFSGSLTNLMIPVAAGESVTGSCSGGTGYLPQAILVFSQQ